MQLNLSSLEDTFKIKQVAADVAGRVGTLITSRIFRIFQSGRILRAGGTPIDIDAMVETPSGCRRDYSGRPWENDAFFCGDMATAYWKAKMGLLFKTFPEDQCSRAYEFDYGHSDRCEFSPVARAEVNNMTYSQQNPMTPEQQEALLQYTKIGLRWVRGEISLDDVIKIWGFPNFTPTKMEK
ncbi:hypothetical protein PWP93_25280 [Paraburkholderia sp. A1RI-2L]|uniref:hypothetical protein n=1 Tax=Paraburkholderia sp. A1RI-2L TaxID=3028367 RepID=UPI003B7C13DE